MHELRNIGVDVRGDRRVLVVVVVHPGDLAIGVELRNERLRVQTPTLRPLDRINPIRTKQPQHIPTRLVRPTHR